MESIGKEQFKNFIILTVIKIICFYIVLVLFNAKAYLIGEVDSLSSLIKLVFFSDVILKALALTCATGMLYFLTIIPATLICYIIEKTIGKDISAKYYSYIAILLSTMFFSRSLIDYDELYLSYLLFLPYELLWNLFKKNWGCLGLWGIVCVLTLALYTVFQYLGTLDNPTSTEKNSIKYHSEKVYICPTKTSKVFHKNKFCKALNRCSGQIKEVKIDEAQEAGRRRCKLCYQ